MTGIPLDDLMRFERGEVSAFESARIERALASDPEAREWLDWLQALRRAARSEDPDVSSSSAEHSDAAPPEAAPPEAAPPEAGPSEAGPSGTGASHEAVDADEIAAFALGDLSAGEARDVRARLDGTPDGYAMLESALEESAFLAEEEFDVASPPLDSSGRRIAESPRTRPRPWGWLAAAVVIVGLGVAVFRSMGDHGTPSPDPVDLTALAERVPMPVPTLRNPDVTRGLVAYGDNDYETAAEQLARAVAEDQGDGLGWLYLGSARLLLGDDAGAVSALRTARERAAPSLSIEATWQLAQAYLARGEREQALETLEALTGSRRESDARRLLDAIPAEVRSGGR